jgi:hypothetical protein
MNLSEYISPSGGGWVAVLSLVLLVSGTIKVGTTGLWLWGARSDRLSPRAEGVVWWSAKASALSLCLSAIGLASLAGDSRSQLAFTCLFVLAAPTVGWQALRRIRGQGQSLAGAPGMSKCPGSAGRSN